MCALCLGRICLLSYQIKKVVSIVHATLFPQKRPNVKKSKFDRVALRDICTGMVAISSDPLTRYSRWNQHAQTTKPRDVMHLLTNAKADLGDRYFVTVWRCITPVGNGIECREGVVEVSA